MVFSLLGHSPRGAIVGRPRGRGRVPRFTLLVSVGILLAHPAAADELRCGGSLIQVGDPKVRLIAECGEPISREVVAVVRSYDDGRQLRSNYAEDWSYESAGVSGYRLLRFEGGRLVGEGMRCSGRLVKSGDTTATVLERCGEPIARDAAGLVQDSPGPAPDTVSTEAPVEQWVYDLGAGTLLRIVTLWGGRITRIEVGPRR